MNRGFSLLELLIALAVLGSLASMGMASHGRDRQRLELESALRRVRVGLDRGRMAALHKGEPCGLRLTHEGWRAPVSTALPTCPNGLTPLREPTANPVVLHSNLPDTVRFSANGLVLDGGLVVLQHPRLADAVCLVIGLPLGITRTGRYHRDPLVSLNSSQCWPNDAG